MKRKRFGEAHVSKGGTAKELSATFPFRRDSSSSSLPQEREARGLEWPEGSSCRVLAVGPEASCWGVDEDVADPLASVCWQVRGLVAEMCCRGVGDAVVVPLRTDNCVSFRLKVGMCSSLRPASWWPLRPLQAPEELRLPEDSSL